MKFTDEQARQAPFTDDDLFFWKNLCGNHLTDEENLEIHAMTLRDLIARLEASERLCGSLKELESELARLYNLVEDQDKAIKFAGVTIERYKRALEQIFDVTQCWCTEDLQCAHCRAKAALEGKK